jgi:hypothetical protein
MMPMFNPLANPSVAIKNNIQVNAVGLSIELELREGYGSYNASSATVKKIIIKKPNGDIVSKDAEFVNDGSNGLIRYKTVLGDLNQAGIYSVQAYVETSFFAGYSTITSFQVYSNL